MHFAYQYILNLVKTHGENILWILILYFFGKAILTFVIKRIIGLADDGDDTVDSRTEKRARTLGHILVNMGNVVIYAVILLLVLSLMGVDIRPILAGIGIGGLAIGFGAQSLVKDLVMGLFILIEAQYDVGDRVKIGACEGEVVRVTMRSTVLRDDEGRIYFISNGTVNNVVNLSKKMRPQE